MKVLLLNQFFHPDLSATAQLATDLAEDLVREGFEVTALAAQGSYLGGERLPSSEVNRGVRIARVRCTSLGKGTIARRLVDYGSFYSVAALRLLVGRRFDVVVAMSTPPLVATLGALVRKTRRTRFVYWLQDVYPELAIELGVVRAGSPAAAVLERLSSWTLRSADAAVVLGDAMGDRVRAKGVDASRIHVVPNWADEVAIRPVPAEANEFRRSHGLADKRVVLYSGNMGRAHDLATILGAARALRDQPDLRFVFVGDGAKRAEVEAAARELPSIRLLPYQPRERLSESLSSGDIHVVTQEPCTVGLIEPSKLYGVMAVGRPVLYIGPPGTEAARTVEREGIGAIVACGDATSAVAGIERLLADRESLGTRARAAFEARYRRKLRTSRFAAILRTLGARSPALASEQT
jgi:colanic acid biosynthesis glycosyl transferase WcaI